MSNLIQEIQKRKTFGIISHPDAGKTTLTEKLLLFGGAIQEAGAVKSNKIKKGATSDFMEIERQRGISVATSVLAFNYKDHKINILDTPGHKDFAESSLCINFRGARYNIGFFNKSLKKNTKAKKIIADGKEIQGTLVPAFEKGTHNIEVYLDK